MAPARSAPEQVAQVAQVAPSDALLDRGDTPDAAGTTGADELALLADVVGADAEHAAGAADQGLVGVVPRRGVDREVERACEREPGSDDSIAQERRRQARVEAQLTARLAGLQILLGRVLEPGAAAPAGQARGWQP